MSMTPPPIPRQFERYIFAFITMSVAALTGLALGMTVVLLVRWILTGVPPHHDRATDGFAFYVVFLAIALLGGYLLGMRVWISLMRGRLPREAVLYWALYGQPRFVKRYFENVVDKVFEDDATPGMLVVFLLGGLVCGVAPAAERSTAPTQQPTPVNRCGSANPLITEDSIGVLFARASVEELLARCPTARRIRHRTEENVWPALQFRLGRDTVTVFQSREALVPGWPPDWWIIAGSGARLPLGQTLRSSWRDLQQAYGRSEWAGLRAMMQFCRFPRLVFEMRAPTAGEPIDAAAIPDSAAVIAVWVNAQGFAPSPCR